MDLQNMDAGWSSLVARRAHNPKAVGSNPAPATNLLERYNDHHTFLPVSDGSTEYRCGVEQSGSSSGS